MVGIIIVVINNNLQHCRSFWSLKSPGSWSSLWSSLLMSLLISLCWRKRSSNLAVRSSHDLEMESGWPGVKPMWFNIPSEHDICFRFKLGFRYTDIYFSSDGTEEIPVTWCLLADLSCQGPSIKCDSRPGTTVWLSCRDVISLWNLCCAEQRLRRYCAIFELSVMKPCFFPLGPPHSMISLRLWKTHKCHLLETRSQMSYEALDLTSTFTPVEMESVSLQRKRLVTVRMWFFISYTMIPLAQTPKTNSPTTGLFSLPTRWNITPYSGNCWAIWRTWLNTFAFHSKLFTVQAVDLKKKKCKHL